MKKIRFPFTAHLDVPFNDQLTVDVRLTEEQERALAEAAEKDGGEGRGRARRQGRRHDARHAG